MKVVFLFSLLRICHGYTVIVVNECRCITDLSRIASSPPRVKAWLVVWFGSLDRRHVASYWSYWHDIWEIFSARNICVENLNVNCDKFPQMSSVPEQFHPLSQAPDLPEGRVAFRLSGGANAVVAARRRHSQWQGRTLIAISILSILFAPLMLGWAASLACSLTVLTSYSIFSLAQGSLSGQLKAVKKSESFDNSLRFEQAQLVISMHVAAIELFLNLSRLREIMLLATQRALDRLFGLVHVALSKRVLPTPEPLR